MFDFCKGNSLNDHILKTLSLSGYTMERFSLLSQTWVH